MQLLSACATTAYLNLVALVLFLFKINSFSYNFTVEKCLLSLCYKWNNYFADDNFAMSPVKVIFLLLTFCSNIMVANVNYLHLKYDLMGNECILWHAMTFNTHRLLFCQQCVFILFTWLGYLIRRPDVKVLQLLDNVNRLHQIGNNSCDKELMTTIIFLCST